MISLRTLPHAHRPGEDDIARETPVTEVAG